MNAQTQKLIVMAKNTGCHIDGPNMVIGSDELTDPSSPDSTSFDDPTDLLNSAVADDVTQQLAAAGPVGIAAAAAIATGKKRKRAHLFETNPSIRKRQQTRLLRKLKATIEEYTTRVGQQAVVLCCTPGKSNGSQSTFKVFGSQPLEQVVKQNRQQIMSDLEQSLTQTMPAHAQDTHQLHELPPLVIDGIPTPVDKMTQAQLRAFIPEMLKYSTGRSKPGWGKKECIPVWWPDDVPWANVRSDVRSEEMKKKISWTQALRTIVKNCYKHHGRDDLLPQFDEQHTSSIVSQTTDSMTHAPVVQTITGADGSVRILHVVQLSDGTTAQLVPAVAALGEATQAAQTLTATDNSVDNGEHLSHLQDGQIVFGSDSEMVDSTMTSGQVSMITIPVSMYGTMVNGTAISALQMSEDVKPVIESEKKVPDATQAVEVMTVTT